MWRHKTEWRRPKIVALLPKETNNLRNAMYLRHPVKTDFHGFLWHVILSQYGNGNREAKTLRMPWVAGLFSRKSHYLWLFGGKFHGFLWNISYPITAMETGWRNPLSTLLHPATHRKHHNTPQHTATHYTTHCNTHKQAPNKIWRCDNPPTLQFFLGGGGTRPSLTCTYMYIYICARTHVDTCIYKYTYIYGVATIRRILKFSGFFCKI